MRKHVIIQANCIVVDLDGKRYCNNTRQKISRSCFIAQDSSHKSATTSSSARSKTSFEFWLWLFNQHAYNAKNTNNSNYAALKNKIIHEFHLEGCKLVYTGLSKLKCAAPVAGEHYFLVSVSLKGQLFLLFEDLAADNRIMNRSFGSCCSKDLAKEWRNTS